MTGAVVLGLATGLVLLFGMLALFCSALCEMISNLLQMRAKYLLRGLRTLLDEPASSQQPSPGTTWRTRILANVGDGLTELHKACLTSEATDARKKVDALAVAANGGGGDVPATTLAVDQVKNGLTLALYGNPLLRSLQSRRILFPSGKGLRNPAYLSGRSFVRALVDTLVPDASGSTTLVEIQNTIEGLPVSLPARRSLLALVRTADGNLARFEELVEHWYDENMAIVSGWYKRWSRVVLGVIGLVIAVAANVDTVQVARNLYVDQPVRAAVLDQVADGRLCQDVIDPQQRARCAGQEITELAAAGLPVGWTGDPWSDGPLLKIIGWGLTGFAVSFGAPFWFTALSRLAPLRTTGPKPAS